MPRDLFKEDDDGEGSDFSFSRMAENIIPSTVKLAKDTAYPIMHPIETVKGLNALGSGLGQKLAQATIPGVTRESMPNPQNVDAANAVGDFYKERYGGVDNVLNTLQEDPAGALGDLAGVLSMGAYGTSRAAPSLSKALQKTAGFADPLSAPTHLAKALPSKSLYRAGLKFKLDPKKGMTKKKAKDLSNQAYELDIAPNDTGAEKLELARQVRGENIDASVKGMPSTTEIPVDEIGRYAPEAREKMLGTGRGSKTGGYVDKFDDTMEEFMNRVTDSSSNGARGEFLTPDEVQGVKIGRYSEAGPAAYGQEGKIPSVQEANKVMARGAKEALEVRNPELKGLNTAYADIDRINDAVPWNEANGFGTDYSARVIAGSAGAGKVANSAIGVASHYLRSKAASTALLIKKLAANPKDNTVARALSKQTGLTVQEIKESKPEDLFEKFGGQ